jgi:hypothetical protein
MKRLTLDERMDACTDALGHVNDLARELNDLALPDWRGVLDDIKAHLEMLEVALELAEQNEAAEQNKELRREYERGLL